MFIQSMLSSGEFSEQFSSFAAGTKLQDPWMENNAVLFLALTFLRLLVDQGNREGKIFTHSKLTFNLSFGKHNWKSHWTLSPSSTRQGFADQTEEVDLRDAENHVFLNKLSLYRRTMLGFYVSIIYLFGSFRDPTYNLKHLRQVLSTEPHPWPSNVSFFF